MGGLFRPNAAGDLPDECPYLLETLREVYANDALARKGATSGEQRLRFERADSAYLMGELKRWLRSRSSNTALSRTPGAGT